VLGTFRYFIPADAGAVVLHSNETVCAFRDWISAMYCNLMGSIECNESDVALVVLHSNETVPVV